MPQLEEQRAAIETEIGERLRWNPYPDKLDKIIVLDRVVDLDDRLAERVDKFKKSFGPGVKSLDLTQAEPAEERETELSH